MAFVYLYDYHCFTYRCLVCQKLYFYRYPYRVKSCILIYSDREYEIFLRHRSSLVFADEFNRYLFYLHLIDCNSMVYIRIGFGKISGGRNNKQNWPKPDLRVALCRCYSHLLNHYCL